MLINSKKIKYRKLYRMVLSEIHWTINSFRGDVFNIHNPYIPLKKVNSIILEVYYDRRLILELLSHTFSNVTAN